MDSEIWKHHCTSCMNQVQDILFLCTQCVDFSLCMQCYICGIELGSHKNSHAVNIIDLGTFPVFKEADTNIELIESTSDIEALTEKKQESNKEKQKKIELDEKKFKTFLESFSKEFLENGIFPEQFLEECEDSKIDDEEYEWRALDELTLLEGVSRFGFGNWKDIANNLSQTTEHEFSPEEVEKHYNKHYINGIIGKLSWIWMHTDPTLQQLSKFPFDSRNGKELIEENKDNCDHLFKDIPQSELDALGYLPKRDDYEREFDNEAEALIANLIIGAPDEDEIEKKFKLAQIDMYQRRLIQRFRKKAIIRESELVSVFLRHIASKGDKDNLFSPESDNKKEHEKRSLISPFLRYLRKNDLNQFITDLIKEHYLKLLLKKFLKYHYLQLEDFKDIKEFEEKYKIANESAKNDSDNFESKSKRTPKKDNSEDKKSKTKKSTVTFMDDDDDLLDSMFADENDFDKEILNFILSQESKESIFNITNSIIKDMESVDADKFLKEATEFMEKQKSTSSIDKCDIPSTSGSSGKSRKRKRSLTSKSSEEFDLSSYPGCHLLSACEKQLCNELKISPFNYINYKTIIIRHFNKANSKIDPNLIPSSSSSSSQSNLKKMLEDASIEKQTLEKITSYLNSIGLVSSEKKSSK